MLISKRATRTKKKKKKKKKKRAAARRAGALGVGAAAPGGNILMLERIASAVEGILDVMRWQVCTSYASPLEILTATKGTTHQMDPHQLGQRMYSDVSVPAAVGLGW